MRLVYTTIGLVILCLTVACNFSSKQASATSNLSPIDLRLSSYDLKLLSDTSNPYLDDYNVIDIWMFDNFSTASTDASSIVLNPTSDSIYLYCPVDSDGYKLPYRDYLVSIEEARRNGKSDYGSNGSLMFYAVGCMSDNELIVVKELTYEVMAEYLPRIPSWLANSDYSQAAFVPNGDFLTVGPIESTSSLENSQEDSSSTNDSSGCCGSPGDRVYYHYSADGDLLSTDKAWLNTFDGLRVHDYPAPVMDVRLDGIVTFSDEDGTVIAVYDYDWTKLGTTLPPMRDLHYFLFYPKATLDRVYSNQQHL